jgi:hypothetical protein
MGYHITRYRHRPMSGISSAPRMLPRQLRPLNGIGSLGDDAPPSTTLDQPTLTDPATAQWQGAVLVQLQQGVNTLKTAELQKWMQIAATLMIPVAGAVWKLIFKGVKDVGSGV